MSSGIGRVQHYFKPHFDYCIVVWGSCGKVLSNKLQKLQNLAARVLNFNYDADAPQLLKNLNWNNLETWRQILKLKAEMVYKSLNGFAPDHLPCKFIPRSDINNSYDLRNSAN